MGNILPGLHRIQYVSDRDIELSEKLWSKICLLTREGASQFELGFGIEGSKYWAKLNDFRSCTEYKRYVTWRFQLIQDLTENQKYRPPLHKYDG